MRLCRLTGTRRAWLSITPEPERELPAAVAALRAGGPPTAEAVARERGRIERFVVRARRRPWLAYMREVGALIERPASSTDPAVVARARGRERGRPEPPRPSARPSRPLSRPHQRSKMSTDTGTLIAETDDSRDLTAEQRDLRERARRFVDEVLIPNEELAERSGGQDPRRAARPDQARVDRGGAERRPARPRARRPGLVEARVVPGRGAVRALDQRAVVAHPGRLQRARERDAGADRALPRAGAARRAPRRLRRHRGQRRLGPVADRGHGRAQRRRLE